jgi:ssDNA-binding Zn-finger/Zn-ribbon topoisomerase 1
MTLRRRRRDNHPFFGCSRWPDCDATHGATSEGEPLGIPGDSATRHARKRAHLALDRLWQTAETMYPNASDAKSIKRLQRLARVRSYEWLADQLGLTSEECHIGRFDMATCDAVAAICMNENQDTIRAWAKDRRAIACQP